MITERLPTVQIGEPADDPSGAMAVQPPPIGRQEDGPFHALADRQVDCPGGAWRERDGDDLPDAGEDVGQTGEMRSRLFGGLAREVRMVS
jgi:hypothetical protein